MRILQCQEVLTGIVEALEQKMERYSAGSNLEMNTRRQCNVYSIDCAMLVSVVMADGMDPAGTLKLHGTNQLQLDFKAKY